MDGDNRQEALKNILKLAESQGYITYDNIFDTADKWNLSIDVVDWLSNNIAIHGVIVCESAPQKEKNTNITGQNVINESKKDFTDYAQIEYDEIYNKVLRLQPALINFVNEVKKIKPPQHKELKGLIHQAKEGNEYARNRIIEMHLRLALKVALQRALLYDEDIDECIGNACLGLRLAIDSYNPYRNGPFGSYAPLWMIQVMAREQGTKRPTVYYPVHKKEQFFAVYPKLKDDGCLKCDKISSCITIREKIIELLKCEIDQVDDVINALIPMESIEELKEKLNDDNNECDENDDVNNFPDAVIDAEDIVFCNLSEYEKNKILYQMIGELNDREKKIIELKYGLEDGKERTLEEIGNGMDLTRERIRQIIAKILRKFRHPSRSREFADYYEFQFNSPYDEIIRRKHRNKYNKENAIVSDVMMEKASNTPIDLDENSKNTYQHNNIDEEFAEWSKEYLDSI